MIGMDQLGKTPYFKHKMRSDKDIQIAESSGAHMIPSSTPAKKYEKPHYYINEGTSFSPATQKFNVRTEQGNVARIRAKFETSVPGKSPNVVTFERLPGTFKAQSETVCY